MRFGLKAWKAQYKIKLSIIFRISFQIPYMKHAKRRNHNNEDTTNYCLILIDNLIQNKPHLPDPIPEPNAIAYYQKVNINARNEPRQVLKPIRMVPMFLVFAEVSLYHDFGDHEHCDDKPPEDDVDGVIMPEWDETDHSEDWDDVWFSTQWHVQVSNKPVVEPSVPHSPESLKPVIIKNTPTHVVNHFHTIHFRPQPGSFPYDQKLVPNKNQVKKRKRFHFGKGHWRVWCDNWY